MKKGEKTVSTPLKIKTEQMYTIYTTVYISK